ncbi:trans-sialidase, putative, partial [Trypanosoma cruzi marinkellei]
REALTKGLVGFLSNTSSDSTWADEYLGVNATINKGQKGKVTSAENGGLTFEGPGAWAEWPVDKKGQNVPYHFANYKFTLVATVSIDKEPKESSNSIPLMGVRMNDTSSGVLFGLSYTHEKKWQVIFSDDLRKPLADGDGDGWEPNKKYQVALRMDSDGGLMVYVDGEEIYDTENYEDEEDDNFTQKLETLLSSHSVSHFYIGGDSTSGSADTHVTVSNVLLYSRALKNGELETLMKRNAVAAAEAKLPAPEVAAETTHVSEPSRQPATVPVVTNEVQQDATPSPQSQHPPAQTSENTNGSTDFQSNIV